MASTTSRQRIRVLYISTDESLLHPKGSSFEAFKAVAEGFSEIHIVVLRTGIAPRHPVLRIGKNMWVYTINHQYWWWVPVVAVRPIHQELFFAEGFRADLIVATDPYESAGLAWWIGRKYGRPVQVHVAHEILRKGTNNRDKNQLWRTRIAMWVLPKVASVRTNTEALADRVRSLWPQIPQVEVLPRYFQSPSSVTATDSTLKEQYPQFSFLYVFVGPLTYDGAVSAVIDAARVPLANPSVGLIIIGDGNARHEYERRVQSYGIEANVVFIRDNSVTDTYVAIADVLIITDTTVEADDLLLFAARHKRAIIATETTYRRDVFENALQLIPAPTMVSLMTEMNRLLNDYGLRHSLGVVAESVSSQLSNQTNEEYCATYRFSLERGLWADEERTLTKNKI